MKRWTSGPLIRSGAAAVAALGIAGFAYFASVANSSGDPTVDDSAPRQVIETTAEGAVVDAGAVPLQTCSLGCGGTHD